MSRYCVLRQYGCFPYMRRQKRHGEVDCYCRHKIYRLYRDDKSQLGAIRINTQECSIGWQGSLLNQITERITRFPGRVFKLKVESLAPRNFFSFLNTKLISDMCFFLLLLFYRAELYFVEGEFHELYHRIFENKSNTALEGLLML